MYMYIIVYVFESMHFVHTYANICKFCRFQSHFSHICRFILLEDRCRFLSNFSVATADVDIPGEYLQPKVVCGEHWLSCHFE